MVGDFNDIKNGEKKGGIIRLIMFCFLFNRLISIFGVYDIKILGGKYIWMGKRFKYIIMFRIDRVLVNNYWMDMYFFVIIFLLSWIGFDYRLLFLNIEGFRWKKF